MCENMKDLEAFDDSLVYLADDEGNEYAFEFLDAIELDGGEYVVLNPVEDEDGGVVILQFEGENEDESENYVPVEDDEVCNKVFAVFKERNKDVFDFVDEE